MKVNLELWIPGKFPSINSVWRKHWKFIARTKAQWTDDITLYARQQRVMVPCCGVSGRCHFLHVTETELADPDNLSGFAQKVILDAVLGSLHDGRRNVHGIVHDFITRPESPGVYLSIVEDVEATAATRESMTAAMEKYIGAAPS